MLESWGRPSRLSVASTARWWRATKERASASVISPPICSPARRLGRFARRAPGSAPRAVLRVELRLDLLEALDDREHDLRERRGARLRGGGQAQVAQRRHPARPRLDQLLAHIQFPPAAMMPPARGGCWGIVDSHGAPSPRRTADAAVP